MYSLKVRRVVQLIRITQGPKLMEHDIVAILSLILEAEEYAEESYLALKF